MNRGSLDEVIRVAFCGWYLMECAATALVIIQIAAVHDCTEPASNHVYVKANILNVSETTVSICPVTVSLFCTTRGDSQKQGAPKF